MDYLKHRNATLQGKVEHLTLVEKALEDCRAEVQDNCDHNIVAECPSCIEYSYQYPRRMCLKCGLEHEQDNCGSFGDMGRGFMQGILNDTDDRVVCKIERDAMFKLRHEY